MHKSETLRLISKMSTSERIKLALGQIDTAWDKIINLIQIHENNRIILYSDLLSQQVGKSFAAHAFNSLQSANFDLELVKLSALWDEPDLDAATVPTLLELVDDVQVKQAAMDTRVIRAMQDASWLTRDLEGIASGTELTAINDRLRERQREREVFHFERQWRAGVVFGRRVEVSNKLDRVRRYRSKFVAHNLSRDRKETKGIPFQFPKYGYERSLLRITCRVVNAIYGAVADTDFGYQGSFEIAKKNAENLWTSCRFSSPG